jgi:hypothetical protein
MTFFIEMHVYLQLGSVGLFGQNTAYPHLETRKLQEVFLSKPNQFSQENNVLYEAASNIVGFLWIDTSVSLSQLNKHTWCEQSPSPP